MLSNATRIARINAVKGGSSSVCKRAFSWNNPALAANPNAPLNLDPSMQALLQDIDMSLLNHKPGPHHSHYELTAAPVPTAESRELQTLEEAEAVEVEEVEWTDELESSDRKSPAARFGSIRYGQVVIPQELQNAIENIIEESDKRQLHSDAKRLFVEEDVDGEGSEWQLQLNPKYRSRKQGERHAERDALAFASVVLPAHYASLTAVFEHIKLRLGASWEVDRVLDWGSGVGTGLWASLFSFQNEHMPFRRDMLDIAAKESSLKSYIGIDKREGLTATARKLFDHIPTSESMSMSICKTLPEGERRSREDSQKTVAMSAFTLSSLPTPLARKALVKEMWESGAHTLILVDHNTKEGFEVIAQAREYLLRQGKKEVEKAAKDAAEVTGTEVAPLTEAPSTIQGAFVIAPCSHDGRCPILDSGNKRLTCGFRQRVQRPEFVRRTKHSGMGHEDVEYSYVVIQRGARPSAPVTEAIGRAGLVAKWAEKAAASKVRKELELFDASLEGADPLPVAVPVSQSAEVAVAEEPVDMGAALRQEAFYWPRLVVPPMKKSGHVILDSCTSEGKLMRMTIPKSQGKQEYYDARKSGWGDLFPHPPKNKPQERVVLRNSAGKVKSVERSHIGKNANMRDEDQGREKRDLERSRTKVRAEKKENRRWERNQKAEMVWSKD